MICCFRASILEAENELRLRPRKNRFFQRFNGVFSNSPRRSALNPSFLSGNSFSLTKSLSCRWKSYRTQEAWQTDFVLGWAVQFRLFVYFLNHPSSPQQTASVNLHHVTMNQLPCSWHGVTKFSPCLSFTVHHHLVHPGVHHINPIISNGHFHPKGYFVHLNSCLFQTLTGADYW